MVNDHARPSALASFSLGTFASLVAGALAVGLLLTIVHLLGKDVMPLILALFLVIPVAMGIAGNHWWRRVNHPMFGRGRNALLQTLLGLAMAAIFAGEGWICLVMASPLVLLGMVVGIVIGERLETRRSGPLNASVAVVLALFMVADVANDHVHFGQVTSSIVIHATPDHVWRNVVAHPPDTTTPRYWLFRLGLPMPVAIAMEGRGIGARRVGLYSGGISVDEVVTDWKPGRELGFDITSQPNHPEVLGHLHVDHGSLTMTDNGDGTTTLTARSSYRLYVAPAWYFDLWVQNIVGNVQLRVMEHVRELAEKENANV
jgi:hypothetical protein